MPTAIVIGLPETCRQVERQLALLATPPRLVGWISTRAVSDAPVTGGAPLLGDVDHLETILAEQRPDLALVSLPAAMHELVASIRTRLRRAAVPDRFLPTLEDQLTGIGPRTQPEIDLTTLLGRPPRTIDEVAVAEVINDRRVLITGAGGSIGGELARLAARFDPRTLTLVDRSENALFEIDRQIARTAPHLDRTALLHDVVEAEETVRRFARAQPQVVFHAAAHKHVPMMEDHPSAAIDNNLFGTKSVVDAADATGVERFVMISTDKAVNPSSIMGATKRLAEQYIQHVNQQSRTSCSIVRFGNVLGSSGSVLDVWSQQIAEGGPVTVTDPAMTRYFMTIPEAAALVMQAAALADTRLPAGEVFLLDMDEPVRILDLALNYIAAHGLEAAVADGASVSGDGGRIAVIFTGARPGEKLHEQLAFDAEAMRPTRHPDINIWMLPRPDRRYIEQTMRALSPARRPRDAGALAAIVRELVPEMVQPMVA